MIEIKLPFFWGRVGNDKFGELIANEWGWSIFAIMSLLWFMSGFNEVCESRTKDESRYSNAKLMIQGHKGNHWLQKR